MEFIKNIDSNLEQGTWIYIFGDEVRAEEEAVTDPKITAYGTGKSFLLDCIANALSHRRIPGLYVTEEALYLDIKSTYSRGSEESETEALDRYYNVPVLLIDDLFTAPYKDWAEGKLYSILDERQKKGKITIMTSNYATGRIRNRLPVNGAKIASRIVGQAILIEMIGPDRREEEAKKRKM
ncbi:P-loop NTPase family protein [Paenibacillus gallinarum]|uniref:ATP-binding protein n=1 Tax=Paenibacillus gallinarum TaxID=2762232 RepID=A0ABR8SWM9_9BACL|nr:ATP-binding protein [Paenibacillus gallinarum]MBD7967723.1 ATP-binding protein [Paenibacillus gallinarum]